MKLQARLGLLVSVVVVSVSSSIGIFAVTQSYFQQLEFNDTKIEEVITQLSNSKEDPLSLASFLADQSSFPFSLSLINESGEIVVIDEGAGEIVNLPSQLELARATAKPVNVGESRLRVLELDGAESLLIGYSLTDIRDARNQNGIFLAGFTFIILLVAIPLSFLIFKRDVRLNQAARALQERQSKMLEFLGDAAHELRTPLTVVRGYFELLKRGRLSEIKQGEYQAQIDREIERMKVLIDELLIAGELDSKEVVENSHANLSIAVDYQLAHLRNLQPKRPVISEVDADLSVRMNEEELNRLLANIFSNIQRYTPIDSLVEVKGKSMGSLVILEVTDSGPGLPPKFYEAGIRAFQRFDDSRSRETGGSGLGMSIMQKTVERWGGKIQLSPNKPNGLRIKIEFKLGI